MKKISVLLIFYMIFMVLLSACKIDYDSEYASGGCLFSFSENSNGIVFAGMEKAVREDEFLVPSHIYGQPVIGIGNHYQNTDIFTSQVANLEYVKKLEIPSTVEIIFDSAFKYHDELESVRINSAKEIGSYAFSGCTNLKQVILPENLGILGSYVFSGCSSLTEIILPNNLTTIEKYAFEKCSKLLEIILPVNVNVIGENVFKHCNQLEKIIVLSSNPPKLGGSLGISATNIYVPAESVELYKTAPLWSDYADKIFSVEELEIPIYVVYFDSNGGTKIESCTVQANKEITVEPLPEKTGTAFAGWFYDEQFTQKVEFPFSPESNVTLYAEFVSPPESTTFTSSNTTSSIAIEIAPSASKYFECYRIVVEQHYSSTSLRAVRAPKVLIDETTTNTSKTISGLDGSYYHSVEVFVLDKFGQSSEGFYKAFEL